MREELILAVVVSLSVLLGTAQSVLSQEEREEHVDSQPFLLEAKLYWFYEAIGKLRDVHRTGRQVEGYFLERMRHVPFTISPEALQDVESREVGYKMAIETMLAFMAPRGVIDNAANREYLQDLQIRLENLTGEKIIGYQAWRCWFDENRSKLKWSKEKDRLVVGE